MHDPQQQAFNDIVMASLANLSERSIRRIQELAKASEITDPKLMALPHPARVNLMGTHEIQQLQCGNDWPAVKAIVADATLPLHTTLQKLSQASELMAAMYGYSKFDDASSNDGFANGPILAMRFSMAKGALFQTTDALDKMLEHTDISDDIPIGAARAPYPVCYFEFGQSRTNPIKVYNQSTGWHQSEGCYVFEYRSPLIGYEELGEIRHIQLMLTGAPKTNIADDAYQIFTIPVIDEADSVNKTMERYFELHRKEVFIANMIDPDSGYIMASDKELDVSKQAILHLIKIMLYLQSPGATRKEDLQASVLKKQLENLKSSAKQAKAARRLQASYDRIIIGPERVEGDASGQGNHRLNEIHWRRGHYRNQPHGPQMSLRKVIWISPTVVTPAHMSGTTEPEKRTYIIK